MDTLPPRNNTSFAKQLHDVLSDLKASKDDPLQYHQRLAHDYIMKYNGIRGMLIYQEMGSGKSILAASLCESMIEKHSDKKVIFMASKSLHNNFRENIIKYKHLQHSVISDVEIENHITNNYTFISLNAGNMLKQVLRAQKPDEIEPEELLEEQPEWIEEEAAKTLEKFSQLGNLNDTFVVVDEAHNFFNAVVNGSKNALGLYHLMLEAINAKFLFMTGSPIINDPFEVAIGYNIIAGPLKSAEQVAPGKKSHTQSKKGQFHTLFGEDYQDFMRYFVNSTEGLNLDKSRAPPPTIKHADKFANRIMGLTSYYSIQQSDLKHMYPELRQLKVVRVPMSNKQYGLYAAARDRELEEAKRNIFRAKRAPLQKPHGTTSTYRVRSRQISNFVYPNYAAEISQIGSGQFKYIKHYDKLKPETFDIFPTPTTAMDEGLETFSPKILEMLKTMSLYMPGDLLANFRKLVDEQPSAAERTAMIGPGMVYSQFLDSGILLLASALRRYSFEEIHTADELYNSTGSGPKARYCIISGQVHPDVRAELIKAFASSANKKGELMPILFFTSTGAEGLDTKYVKYVMAMEPYWHWARLSQVFARGVRFRSHMELPENERWVQPYLFLSDYPRTMPTAGQHMQLNKIEDTTDITLYQKALQALTLNNSFLKEMRNASIDCSIWNPGACRICNPTNAHLFINDLDKDINSPNPCTLWKEQKIKAQKFIYKNKDRSVEYAYHIDDEDNIHIFEYNPQLKGYEEIWIEHPDYLEVYNAIKTQPK